MYVYIDSCSSLKFKFCHPYRINGIEQIFENFKQLLHIGTLHNKLHSVCIHIIWRAEFFVSSIFRSYARAHTLHHITGEPTHHKEENSFEYTKHF